MKASSMRVLIFLFAIVATLAAPAPAMASGGSYAYRNGYDHGSHYTYVNGFNGYRRHLYRPYYRHPYRPYRSYYSSRPLIRPNFRNYYYERYYPYYYTPYPFFVPGFSFYFGF
jgi:hypothetical protein